MALDESLNKILKEMWRLDEKMISGIEFDAAEKEFYNQHLSVIADYYDSNSFYWSNKQPV